jgi:hypothetical protein
MCAVYDYPGALSNVQIGKETTFGSAVTANKNIGYITNFNASNSNEMERIHGLGSRDAASLVSKTFKLSADIDAIFTEGRLLAYAIGKDTKSGASDPYTHTMADNTDYSLPSFTAVATHYGTTSTVRTLTGCMVDSLTLNLDTGSPLKMSAKLLACSTSLANSGGLTYTADTASPLGPQYGSLKIGTENSEVALARLQNMSFTLNNNLESVFGLGARTAQACIPKKREFEVKASCFANYDSAAGGGDTYQMIQTAFGGTTPAAGGATDVGLIFTVDNGLGAVAGQRQLILDFNNAKITQFDIKTPIDGIVAFDFTAWAKTIETCTYTDDVGANYL